LDNLALGSRTKPARRGQCSQDSSSMIAHRNFKGGTAYCAAATGIVFISSRVMKSEGENKLVPGKNKSQNSGLSPVQ